MKLIVPYTEAIRPIVKEVLIDIYGLKPDFVYVGAGDEEYWKLMKGIWSLGETFLIVEHDVLPWPGALEELEQCPFPWCSCTYLIKRSKLNTQGYGVFHGFGCTKFSAHLIKMLPDVWDQIESRHWKHLDAQFYTQALACDQIPHPHRPPAIHLHK